MPAVIRLGDLSAGVHPSPTANVAASTNVFVNSKGAHRQGDAWLPHSFPLHARTTAVGSLTVYVNSKQLARTGDLLTCGDKCGVGSTNVFSG